MSAAEVLAAALALSDEERERLALTLWDSLQDVGVSQAWAKEIERRVRQIDNGEVELVSWEDARARIHASLAARHR